jgi:hypothetical protein
MKLRALLFAAAVAACGSSSRQAAVEPIETPEKHGGHELPVPELNAYHEVLAPVWHDKVTAKDWAGVCGEAPRLAEAGAKVKAATLPEELGDRETKYRELATTLADLSEQLSTGCDPSKGEDLAGRMTMIHDTFHALMESVSDGAGAHEEHHE